MNPEKFDSIRQRHLRLAERAAQKSIQSNSGIATESTHALDLRASPTSKFTWDFQAIGHERQDFSHKYHPTVETTSFGESKAPIPAVTTRNTSSSVQDGRLVGKMTGWPARMAKLMNQPLSGRNTVLKDISPNKPRLSNTGGFADTPKAKRLDTYSITSNDTEEDVVVYHPVPTSGIQRQPHNPPTTLHAGDPRNFAHIKTFIIGSSPLDFSETVGALAQQLENFDVSGPNSSRASQIEDAAANLSRYSDNLTSWRIRSATDTKPHQASRAVSMEQPTVRSASSTSSTRARSRSPFRKSLMWQSKHGLISSRRPGTNYQGDTSSKSGLATENGLPDHLNCTLWLEHLPNDVTYQAMFDWLEEMQIGRVWALDIKPPQGNFKTSAARLTFFEQSSAQRLYDEAHEPNCLYLDGHKVKVLFNRSGNRARIGYETRVILIRGPTEMMTWEFWSNYFADGIVYELDRWRYVPCMEEGRSEMEIRFARVDGQAQTGIQKIYKDVSMDEKVVARYGRDPCERRFR